VLEIEKMWGLVGEVGTRWGKISMKEALIEALWSWILCRDGRSADARS